MSRVTFAGHTSKKKHQTTSIVVEQPGLLPLLPLTKGGAERTVIESMLDALAPEPEELKAIGFTLATYVLKKKPGKLDWLLKRYYTMHEIMRESPFI